MKANKWRSWDSNPVHLVPENTLLKMLCCLKLMRGKNLHEQKKIDLDVFISKEIFFFLCSPFLPHLKQIVLEQRAFVSHLRELVAWFCFGNQNGRGNLCGFITGAFGVCAARRVVSCCPPPCSRSPIPRLCCLRSWRLFSVPFPYNSGM